MEESPQQQTLMESPEQQTWMEMPAEGTPAGYIVFVPTEHGFVPYSHIPLYGAEGLYGAEHSWPEAAEVMDCEYHTEHLLSELCGPGTDDHCWSTTPTPLCGPGNTHNSNAGSCDQQAAVKKESTSTKTYASVVQGEQGKPCFGRMPASLRRALLLPPGALAKASTLRTRSRRGNRGSGNGCGEVQQRSELYDDGEFGRVGSTRRSRRRRGDKCKAEGDKIKKVPLETVIEQRPAPEALPVRYEQRHPIRRAEWNSTLTALNLESKVLKADACLQADGPVCMSERLTRLNRPCLGDEATEAAPIRKQDVEEQSDCSTSVGSRLSSRLHDGSEDGSAHARDARDTLAHPSFCMPSPPSASCPPSPELSCCRASPSGSSKNSRSEQLKRKIQGHLNKICPENSSTIVQRIAELDVSTTEDLDLVIDSIFKKALTEPHYVETYADMAFALNEQLPEYPPTDGGKPATFKTSLLNICQREFESVSTILADDADLYGLGAEAATFKKLERKHRVLANMKFIGHLFLRRLLSTKVIQSVALDLVARGTQTSPTGVAMEAIPEAHAIECVCELLLAVGFTLESLPTGKHAIGQVCARLVELKRKKLKGGTDVYSKRIQCVIQDLLDIRAAGWRRVVFKTAAKTLGEVQQEQLEERIAQERGFEVKGEAVVFGKRPSYVAQRA